MKNQKILTYKNYQIVNPLFYQKLNKDQKIFYQDLFQLLNVQVVKKHLNRKLLKNIYKLVNISLYIQKVYFVLIVVLNLLIIINIVVLVEKKEYETLILCYYNF